MSVRRAASISLDAQGALFASGLSLVAIQAIAVWMRYSPVVRTVMGASCLVPCVVPWAMARLSGEHLPPNAAFALPLAGALVPVLAALSTGRPSTDGVGDEYGVFVLIPLLASWVMVFVSVFATGLALAWGVRQRNRALF